MRFCRFSVWSIDARFDTSDTSLVSIGKHCVHCIHKKIVVNIHLNYFFIMPSHKGYTGRYQVWIRSSGHPAGNDRNRDAERTRPVRVHTRGESDDAGLCVPRGMATDQILRTVRCVRERQVGKVYNTPTQDQSHSFPGK